MLPGIGSQVQRKGASSQGPEAWFSLGSHTTLLGFYNMPYSSIASHSITHRFFSTTQSEGIAGRPALE